MSANHSTDSLLASARAIAAGDEPDDVLARMCAEAEALVGASAAVASTDDGAATARHDGDALVPLRAAGRELAALRVTRAEPLTREEFARLEVLAEVAGQAYENARLRAEARARASEHARLSDQLLTAEQAERRRLALFLHDTSVQALSGIALMLDAAQHSVAEGRLEEARTVTGAALERLRESIRALRDLSFALEPVVLRDQGFGTAVSALTEQLALDKRITFDVDVSAAEAFSEKVQAALYQIIREALHGAILRGPPSRIDVSVVEAGDGGFEAVIADDAPGERRRASLDAIVERGRSLGARVDVEYGDDGGTTVRLRLPRYAARG